MRVLSFTSGSEGKRFTTKSTKSTKKKEKKSLTTKEDMMMLRVLSFGGGVQSTVLALMAVKGEIERPDYILFADTGDETRATYGHVWRVAKYASEHGLPFHVVSAGNIVEDVKSACDPSNGVKTGRVGQPPFFVASEHDTDHGRLWRKCSSEYKIKPMEQWVRGIMGIAKGKQFPREFKCVKLLGITTDEASRMKPSRNYWEEVQWPLIELNMTRWDCHRYLKAAGWGVVPKSSCKICPYHDNAYWRNLRNETPEEFGEVVEFERVVNEGRIPGTKGKIFLHRSLVPLSEVDLRTDMDRGQYALNLWAAECEGICGT